MSHFSPSIVPCGPLPGTHVSLQSLHRAMWSSPRHTCLTSVPPPCHPAATATYVILSAAKDPPASSIDTLSYRSFSPDCPYHVVLTPAHMSHFGPSIVPCGPHPGTHVSLQSLHRTMWSSPRHTCLTLAPPSYHVVLTPAHMSHFSPSTVPCGPHPGTHVSL